MGNVSITDLQIYNIGLIFASYVINSIQFNLYLHSIWSLLIVYDQIVRNVQESNDAIGRRERSKKTENKFRARRHNSNSFGFLWKVPFGTVEWPCSSTITILRHFFIWAHRWPIPELVEMRVLCVCVCVDWYVWFCICSFWKWPSSIRSRTETWHRIVWYQSRPMNLIALFLLIFSASWLRCVLWTSTRNIFVFNNMMFLLCACVIYFRSKSQDKTRNNNKWTTSLWTCQD